MVKNDFDIEEDGLSKVVIVWIESSAPAGACPRGRIKSSRVEKILRV
jgi:hypothetical protein